MLKKYIKSLRGQLTILMVALLTINCIVLVLLVNYSTSVNIDTIKFEANQQDSIEIFFKPDSLKQAIFTDTYIYLGIIILAGIVSIYLLVGKYTKPIQELSAHMKNINPSGLSQEIIISTKGSEIEDLVYSYNQMARQLNEAFEMQQRFSSNSAHELRTPLAVLQTKIDVFKKKDRNKEEFEELFTVIENYTKRLSSIVGELLDLTQTYEITSTENINLFLLLEEVKNDLEVIRLKKEIKITLSGDNSITVQGNFDLLYRVFYNLVENAIRYNSLNGSININLYVKRNQVFAEIADTGEGISKENRKLIFEPFYRVNKSRSREFGGAGIGLSLVKNILERHGAYISVKENTPKGAIFIVCFRR